MARDDAGVATGPRDLDHGARSLAGVAAAPVLAGNPVPQLHRAVPAAVFDSQEAALEAFKQGQLDRDVVVVLRFQGPKANGMPELHSLSPALSVIQDRGFKVAFVTDGRMSGASGKTPAAIHLSPEALAGGPIARVRDGDIVRLDPEKGELTVVGCPDFAERPCAPRTEASLQTSSWGYGRELFGAFRHVVGSAEEGASVVFAQPPAGPPGTDSRHLSRHVQRGLLGAGHSGSHRQWRGQNFSGHQSSERPCSGPHAGG